MRSIGILNSKGGTGKSTATCCLGVEAIRASKNKLRVGVCDLDAQETYRRWFERRGSPENPDWLSGVDRASEAVERAAISGRYDLLLVDGPPNSLIVTRDAAEAVDLVVIPTRASPLDLESSRDTIALCCESNVPYLVVISDCSPYDRRLAESTIQFLRGQKVPVADQVIYHRSAHITAMSDGMTGPEWDAKAASEIKALWAEIQDVLPQAVSFNKKRRAAK